MQKKQVKKHNRSLFYRISAWLHLWLGLITGIIVIIVCLTGCIWCFNEEITDLLDPHAKIEAQNRSVLAPSQLNTAIRKNYSEYKLQSYSMREGKSILAYLNPNKSLIVKDSTIGNMEVKINPYTGEILSEKKYTKGETPFFRWILNGHRFLWVRKGATGRIIINYSILIFIITLVTGLVLWWPKKWNKSTKDRCFKIKWNGTVKRINYDLHNVLGFYTLCFLLVIACTGIVYGIDWFSKSTYWLTTGGKTNDEYKRLESDSADLGKFYTPEKAMDIAWEKTKKLNADAKGFYIGMADTTNPKATIFITFYPSKGKFYDNRNYIFDQNNLKQLVQPSIYGTPYEQGNPGEKLRKLNYDLHVGSVLGLPGKFLAFGSSLIGASLPITGFIVWWGKKKKSKKKK
ncbi:PepSY-associated TM helix domain-containing protein [Rhizosphaericola mali]|uniref:PepSY domain-containing protein n=1 Tax=Rhizosphaericola mali TaxID=2545455 RepID=A0A5P2G9U6_9BACT|nr:PepSY-associated TM helix domain-containing protein [Rhizosphaericola mali]QES90712.1 PepSY domain-containing protein [Rhizosphaericola mali]